MDKIDKACRGGRDGTVLARKRLVSDGQSLLFGDVEVMCVCAAEPPGSGRVGFRNPCTTGDQMDMSPVGTVSDQIYQGLSCPLLNVENICNPPPPVLLD